SEADAAGKKQFGDDWEKNMQRLRELSGGIPEDTLRRTLADPNGISNLNHAGKESRLQMLQAAQDCRYGDATRAAELEREYATLRAKEREEYARSKGRIR